MKNDTRFSQTLPHTWRKWTTLAIVFLSLSLMGTTCPDGTRILWIKADIRTTSFGIPHIKAHNYASLGYGLGYAYARDNLCILAREIVTARGEEAKYFGASTSRLNRSFLFKLLSRDENLRALFNAQPVVLQDMVHGYAAGYNRWLDETGVQNLPAACAGEPWVRPIDFMDLAAVQVKGNTRGSVSPLLNAVVAAAPPNAASGAANSAGALPMLTPEDIPEKFDLSELENELNINSNFGGGSNAYGLGRDATENGRGMLLGNPHEPWSGIQRFYQAHLTLPGKLNVMGVTQIALPIIVIGFNEDIAWSHTISTAKRFTVYELALDPNDPLTYLVDNQPHAIESETIEIEVLGEAGTRAHTFYRSEHGFMIAADALSPFAPAWGANIAALGGPASVAYAMRDVNEDNVRGVEQWLEVDKATSVQDLKSKLEATIGMPFINTIAADRDGDAFYADIGAVPHVSEQKFLACQGSLIAKVFTISGALALDGSRSACDWGDDPGTPQQGIFGPENLPSLIRSDYVTNSNDSYWLSNPDARLEGFSPLLRRDVFNEVGPRILRTRMGILQVQERLAGTDGLPGNKFDLEKLQQIFYGNRNYSAELELDAIVGLCNAGAPAKNAWPTSGSGTVDVTLACDVLEAWDRTDNLDSVGAHVWRQFFGRLGRAVNKFAVPFDSADPVGTPNTLILNSAVREALGDAVAQLNGLGIPLDAALGDIQYVTNDGLPLAPDGSNQIPMHGGSGQNGVFNVASTPLSAAGYTPVTGGPTYMQTITWDDDGYVVAEAILGFSQSDDPENPHYSDQTEKYSRKEFIRLPFTESEIWADLIGFDRLRDLLVIESSNEVQIDIKPGHHFNLINVRSQRDIPVAILGSDTFDVAEVDVTTLAFGPDGALPAHPEGGHLEDVNDDGFTDLLSHYPTQETGIAGGDRQACVTGETLDGESFEACDRVIVLGGECGLGFELALLLPAILWLRKQRRLN